MSHIIKSDDKWDDELLEALRLPVGRHSGIIAESPT